VAEDEADPDQDLSQTELAKLRSSNHRLRVENLALHTRIERLKSHRSLERSLIIGGMVSLWFFFILSVMTKIIASSKLRVQFRQYDFVHQTPCRATLDNDHRT